MIQVDSKPVLLGNRTPDEIERDDIRRRFIAEAIRRIDGLNGNHTYRQAWKVAIRVLNGMAPEINKV